jgi:hypothetical protein
VNPPRANPGQNGENQKTVVERPTDNGGYHGITFGLKISVTESGKPAAANIRRGGRGAKAQKGKVCLNMSSLVRNRAL